MLDELRVSVMRQTMEATKVGQGKADLQLHSLEEVEMSDYFQAV